MSRPPHVVLGVEEDATVEEIKRARRRKILCVHPDRGGTAREFQQIESAYESMMSARMRPRTSPATNGGPPAGVVPDDDASGDLALAVTAAAFTFITELIGSANRRAAGRRRG